MLSLTTSYAQSDSIPKYSSYGIFDKVIDRFGRELVWNDIVIDSVSSSSHLVLNEGVFEIHYYPNSGFEQVNNVEHQARRLIIQELFSVADSMWGNSLGSEKIIIRFLPIPSNISLNETWPLLASSFYLTPQFTNNFSEASDCIIAQYIQSGKNPFYTLGNANTKSFINSEKIKFSHLDFYTNLNGFNINSDLLRNNINPNEIDLYSIALRELVVGLGVNSFISPLGVSTSSNPHQFTRWDSQLKFQNQNLISYDSIQKKYVPVALPSWVSSLSPTSDCDSLYLCSQSPYFGGSLTNVSVSHCFDKGIECSYLNELCSTDSSVLGRSWLHGVLRRRLSPLDLSVLEALGYFSNICVGNAINQNDFCANLIGVAKYIHFSNTELNQAYLGIIEENSSQSLHISSLFPNSNSLLGIELLDHIGSPVTFSLINDSIKVNNFQKGINFLRFKHTNSAGDVLNAFARVQLLGGEVCEGVPCENLISNSSFENLAGNEPCGIIDELGVPDPDWPNVFIDCWRAFTADPDIHFENCTDNRFDFASGPSSDDTGGNIPIIPDTDNNNILKLFARVYNDNPAQWEESIQGTLAQPLVPGATYEISMRIFRRQGGSPLLSIYFREGEFFTDANFIDSPTDWNLIPGPSQEILAFAQPPQWQTWTSTFTVPLNETNLDRMIIANEIGNLSNTNPNLRRQLFIDDVQLRRTEPVTFDIPNTFICGGTIGSLQNFATPAGGIVSGPGVFGNTSFTFVSQLAGVGTHTLTYTFTSPDGCEHVATDQITVHPTVSFNTAVINPTCGGSCSGSISVAPTASAPANVVYTWQGPSINSNNINSLSLNNLCAGTYTLTATINGACTQTQSYTISTVAPPTANATVSNNICGGACSNTISVVSNSPNNTISWTGGLSGFNPTNVCPGLYTATITSPQGCSTILTVTVTNSSSAGQNVTINNTQTWNGFNAGYNNITISNTGYLTIEGQSALIISGTILVQDGARLMIESSTISFTPNGRILVQPGGRAFLQKAVLTSHCQNQYWLGIEVQGSNAYSQSDTFMSLDPTMANPVNNIQGTNQGGIRIYKDSRIEFANVGVKLHAGTWPTTQIFNSGGLIVAEESTFRNNRRDITFSTYGFSSSQTPSQNYLNQSSFSRCNFEVNSNHYSSGGPLLERVAMYQTTNVYFRGCRWINSSDAIANPGPSQGQNVPNQAALRLNQASCKLGAFVSGTTTIKSEFSGFVYGVFASSSYLNSPNSIKGVNFKCYRGILCSTSSPGLLIDDCRFEALNANNSPISFAIPAIFINNTSNPWVNSAATIPAFTQGPSYGVYLNACASSTIKNNIFNIVGIISNQRVGLYVNNCGGSVIDIRDNEFRGNSFGIRFLNSNRSSSSATIDGTSFKCNQFSINDLHVEINAQNPASTNVGINQNIFFNLNTSNSNIFDAHLSPLTFLPVGRNIWDNVLNFHNYKGRLDEVQDNDDRVSGIGGSGSILAEYSANFQAFPGCGISGMSTNLNALLTDFQEKKTALESYRDDGNPEYYQYLIETINTSNVIQRFNELSLISPALSVDRIVEVMDKETDLPRPFLLNILINNISSLKNGEALIRIDSLQIPFAQWEKDSLFGKFNQLDAKGILEMQLNQSANNAFKAINEELHTILQDTLIDNPSMAIIDFNSKLELISDDYSRFQRAQENYDFNYLVDYIDNRLNEIQASSIESKDLNSLKQLIEETMLLQETDSITSYNYTGFASNYILPELPLTYRFACQIIEKYDSLGFHGDLEYPYEIPSSRSLKKPFGKVNSSELSLFPNPAIDYVQIQSHETDLTDCEIFAYDMSGRKIQITPVIQSKHEWILNVNNWPNGFYIIELRKQGTFIFSSNFAISK